MKFEYHNPIKFRFGMEVFDQIPKLCEGRKVLLVYGGGSIKSTGVYDQITSLLGEGNVSFVEYGNQTTATYQGILDGIELVKKEQIDAVIEVGGASAMDTGKAIAFGAVHENLEDYIEGRKQSDNRHLFNISIPTYPSTGSEANGVCDIMEYHGYGVEIFGAYPDYCLMNPSVTMSLNKKDTAYSAIICFIQTSTWYLGNHQNDIAKGFAKTVLTTLLESLQILQKNPKDERARENIMWASCVNTMGVYRSGVDCSYPWTVFSVGYVPRVVHGVPYREALVPAYLQCLKGISKYHMDDIKGLFTEVFGISATISDEILVNSGCEILRKLLEESDVPLSLAAYGSYPAKDHVIKSLAPEDYGEFTQDEMYQMIAGCY